jgi:hypothetical protein
MISAEASPRVGLRALAEKAQASLSRQKIFRELLRWALLSQVRPFRYGLDLLPHILFQPVCTLVVWCRLLII